MRRRAHPLLLRWQLTMKVERHAGLHVDAKQAVAPAVSWGAAGTQRSFETALRDQRQRVAPNDKGSQVRADARSPGSRSSVTAESNERDRPWTRVASDRVTPSVDLQRKPASPPPLKESPIASFIDPGLAARWRRTAGTQSGACIEVVHAASNSRFLLSREDGVWLLAIQSRACPQDDAAVVAALRELFAKRGLGDLDVVKV